ncbi:hypothetical protein FA13DRAFT_1718722 [Coprinellus micaceus]|uniref:Uncharacterized protein n=1 Tax=Coprinellus micaceus TaxID=71717 RepID=A0A4Y7SER0_COPMI|nr:hypothetical protein FA13DRAFT_1718722 [Coprinellus micaceus]
MPPSEWTTPEEREFLRSFLPEYKACQVKKKYKQFWQRINVDYFAKFPIIRIVFPGLTAGDLTQAQKSQLAAATLKQQQRLKEWYRWRMNPRSRNAGSKISKKDPQAIYNNRSRTLKAYEVYAKLNPQKIDDEEKLRCELGGASGRGQLSIWHEVAKDLFEKAGEEEREAVEREMNGDAESDDYGESPSPESYMCYPKKLPIILEATITPAVPKAGALAFVTVGPSPEQGGKIVSQTLQFGDKPSTPPCSKTWADYDGIVVEELSRFAGRHEFSPEICAAHSLKQTIQKANHASLEDKGTQEMGSANSSASHGEAPPAPSPATNEAATRIQAPTEPRSEPDKPVFDNREDQDEDEDDITLLKPKGWVFDQDDREIFDSTLAELSTKDGGSSESYSVEEALSKGSPSTSSIQSRPTNSLIAAPSDLPLGAPTGRPNSTQKASSELPSARDVNSAPADALGTLFPLFPSARRAPTNRGQTTLFTFNSSSPNWWASPRPSPVPETQRPQSQLFPSPAKRSSPATSNSPSRSSPPHHFDPSSQPPSGSRLIRPSAPNPRHASSILPSLPLPPRLQVRQAASPPSNPASPTLKQMHPPHNSPDSLPYPLKPTGARTAGGATSSKAPWTRAISKEVALKGKSKSKGKAKKAQSTVDKVPPKDALANVHPAPDQSTRRRSTRSSIPSNRQEQLQLIGSNAAQASLAIEKDTNSDPAWLAAALENLRGFDLGQAWFSMVDRWEVMERTLGQGKGKGYLPIERRPEEWQRWTTQSWHGVRADNKPPAVHDSAEFGVAVTRWWSSIQPSFRQSATSFPSPVYSDPNPCAEHDAWAHLRQSGQDGFVSIIILMAWWGRSIADTSEWQEDSLPAWERLVGDISAVLDAIVDAPANLPSSSNKRPREKENTNAPGLQRKKLQVKVWKLCKWITSRKDLAESRGAK